MTHQTRRQAQCAASIVAVVLFLCVVVPTTVMAQLIVQNSNGNSNSGNILYVFTSANNIHDNPVVRHQHSLLQDISPGKMNKENIIVVANTTQEQRLFLQNSVCAASTTSGSTTTTDTSSSSVSVVVTRFDELVQEPNTFMLAQELWKYCALYEHGGVYMDLEYTAILDVEHFADILRQHQKVGITMDPFLFHSPSVDSTRKAMQGSLLQVQTPRDPVVQQMLQFLLETNAEDLTREPLLLPQTLSTFIQRQRQPGGEWYLLQQSCNEDPFRYNHNRRSSNNRTLMQYVAKDAQQSIHTCSYQRGYCCLIFDTALQNDPQTEQSMAILASRTAVYPVTIIEYAKVNQPYIATTNELVAEELPYLATVHAADVDDNVRNNNAASTRPLTFYEVMKRKDCLPTTSCNKCLANKKTGANCITCEEACPCYCQELCKDDDTVKNKNNNNDNNSPDGKYQYQSSKIRLPQHRRDPTRLIPRIVHQTWFEELDPEKYPNMSRLKQSFQHSGWQYHFYTDDEAGRFLAAHFPVQIKQAYDLLIPGAFKADLFRYCVLLIRGGVYADVDVMLGPNLDAAIPPDVAFMVGLDEPGKKIGKRMCLWNGFIAASPGHPFLAKVIETAVNNILQRFTSVDIAAMLCPLPEMSVVTSFSPLFVAGPCLLGSTINTVLGRHPQTQFEAGELIADSANATLSATRSPTANGKIPGRTIILNQNKNDMGAHRFTFLEQNLIVLSTDFPDSDDREKLEGVVHYSETRIRFEIYGVENVYKDNERTKGPLIRLEVQ